MSWFCKKKEVEVDPRPARRFKISEKIETVEVNQMDVTIEFKKGKKIKVTRIGTASSGGHIEVSLIDGQYVDSYNRNYFTRDHPTGYVNGFAKAQDLHASQIVHEHQGWVTFTKDGEEYRINKDEVRLIKSSEQYPSGKTVEVKVTFLEAL